MFITLHTHIREEKITLNTDHIISIFALNQSMQRYDDPIIEIGGSIKLSDGRIIYTKETHSAILDILHKN